MPMKELVPLAIVREAARLQTLDDDYVFLGSMGEQYKMIGNAVPPAFAEILANALTHLYRTYCPDKMPLGFLQGNSSSDDGRKRGERCEQILLAVEKRRAKLTSSQKAKGRKGIRLVVPKGASSPSRKRSVPPKTTRRKKDA